MVNYPGDDEGGTSPPLVLCQKSAFDCLTLGGTFVPPGAKKVRYRYPNVTLWVGHLSQLGPRKCVRLSHSGWDISPPGAKNRRLQATRSSSKLGWSKKRDTIEHPENPENIAQNIPMTYMM
eukprot:gene19114-biopygen732